MTPLEQARAALAAWDRYDPNVSRADTINQAIAMANAIRRILDAPEAAEPPCTDCDGTGITIQTERRCACTLTDEERQSWQDIREGMNR